MASITLKKVPDELHRGIKRIKLDLEDQGIKKSLEDLYIEFIEKGFKSFKKENPTK